VAGGTPWLFPGIVDNADGSKPYSHSTFRRQLVAWQNRIDLRDEAGEPVRVTGHRFRHTLGTRLINSGVPQHVVQKLLGHASPNMTGHYARVHDSTIRLCRGPDYAEDRRDDVGLTCSGGVCVRRNSA